MNVGENVKNSYRADSKLKEIRLYFPDMDLTVNTGQMDSDSMILDEALFDGDSIEFVGCISSEFQITIHGIKENLKGQKIEAYISSDETEEIPIFHGIVDSVQISGDKTHKKLQCYDILYSTSNIDVADWYKRIKFPITLKDFRDSLFERLGIMQADTDLPNDEISIDKQYSPNTMNALDVIKAICQINGVFGIINRNNLFEYRTLPKTDNADISEAVQYQKSIEYQEYSVKPVDKLTIRQTEENEGVSYGDGENNYIIQGNMFTLNLEEEVVLQMAKNIYPNVEGFYYIPFSSDNNGFPWIECGKDIVSYNVYDYEKSTPSNPVYKTISFYILTRNLSGIQNLRDQYSAEGDEYQRVFITDLQYKVDTVIEQVQQMVGKLKDFSLNYVLEFNTEKIVIADGSSVSVTTINFVSVEETQVMIQMEYLLEVETTSDGTNFSDLVLTVKYYYDDRLIDSRQPVETYTDGKHVLKLFYLVSVNEIMEHEWRVVFEARGGQVTLQIGQGMTAINGQGIINTLWNGRLEIEEFIRTIPLQKPNGIVVKSIRESVLAETQVPIGDIINEVIPSITLSHPGGIEVNGITENIEIGGLES